MENRLRGLFALQIVDLRLDELEAQKGDLPQQVVELEDKYQSLRQQLDDLASLIKASLMERDKLDVDIIALVQNVEKYKNQQFQVKNNRQYDALTREIEMAQANMEKSQRTLEELEGKVKVANEDVKKFRVESDVIARELEEKRAELGRVAKLNEDEELEYTHERQKTVVRLAKADLEMYERIRKAKGGRAVVDVRRGACGGCFHRIPPQRLLELRKSSQIYKCEHCGRILVSDEIAQTSTGAA